MSRSGLRERGAERALHSSEQLPNHRHWNSKAFEGHIENNICLMVLLQSNSYITFLC